MKNTYIKIAGILNLCVALLHLIGGQLDLINPLLESNINIQEKAELIGVWHIVTVLLFYTSYYLLKVGFGRRISDCISLLRHVGVLYLLIGFPFIIVSLYYSVLAPQWILLVPIGGLILMGIKKSLANDRSSNSDL